MHREGHVGAALVFYTPLGATALALGFRSLALVGGVGAVLLAMVPDWDQRVPGIAHRGPTHTVWFALVVGLALAALGVAAGQSRGPLTMAGLALFGFLLGSLTICSHVAADALTPMGVRPFAPLGRHYTYDLTTASNPVANYALLALGVAVAVAGAALGRALL